MPVIALKHERPRGLDAVEIERRRREAVIVELHRLEPFIRTTRFFGEARLDYRLEHFNPSRKARKAALEAVDRTKNRMDVRVDHSRQNELPLEVYGLGRGPD